MACGHWQWSRYRPDEVCEHWAGRAVAGFNGHAKRSTLNSAVYQEFPDRAVEIRTRDKSGLMWVLILENPPIQNICANLYKSKIFLQVKQYALSFGAVACAVY